MTSADSSRIDTELWVRGIHAIAPWIMGAVLLTGVYQLAVRAFNTPVVQIEVHGAIDKVKPEEIRSAIRPFAQQGFLSMALPRMQVAIATIPWVARAEVIRHWPDRLEVRIRERALFARWGEAFALDSEGNVFNPGTKPDPGLPQLAGPAVHAGEVMQNFVHLSDQLTDTPFALRGLTVDARGDWKATTQLDTVIRFGRGDPLQHLGRLRDIVAPALQGRLRQVARIDLRYPNGFAVAWRNQAIAPDAPPSSVTQSAADAAVPVP